jgi:hypothetical protein
MSRKNPASTEPSTPSAKQQAPNPTDDDSPPPLKKLRHDSQGAVPITPSTEQKDQQLCGLCPNLCRLLDVDNIDPSDPRLDTLLSEIVLLKQQQRKVIYKNSNNSNRVCTLVNVPRNTTLNSFVKSNDWLDSALDANSPRDDPYDSIYRVVRHCGKRNRDATVTAIKDLGVPIANPMTPTEFTAMVADVRLTGVQEETLTQHLRHRLGKGICPARKHLRMMCEGHSEIITGSVKHVYDPKSGEEENIQFSYKDPPTEFLKQLQRKIDSHKVDINKVKSLTCVFGGDHGQGAFQFGAKVEMHFTDTAKSIPFIISLAEVVCRKDTGELLEKTIIKPLAKGMKTITNCNLLLSRGGDGKVECIFDNKERDKTTTSGYVVDSYLCGDLAFMMMAMGREGMSGKWCYICKLGHAQFKNQSAAREKWTWTKLAQTLQELREQGEGVDSLLGVKNDAWFPFIKITNYVVPLLHVEIGIGNDLLDLFRAWVDMYIDCLNDEEIRTRSAIASATRMVQNVEHNFVQQEIKTDVQKHRRKQHGDTQMQVCNNALMR